jgi:hypothetical protein
MRHRSVSTGALSLSRTRVELVRENSSTSLYGISRATKVAAGLWIALFVAALVLPSAPAANAAPSRFELLGTHPQAAAQSTAAGKTIYTLKPYNGQIYAGYGDYNANTGPIAITPFDPVTQSFGNPLLSADTEAIQLYREINGRLFAPATDSQSGNDYAVSGTSGTAYPWQNVSGLGSSHVFDTFTLTGEDLWMVGSRDWNAVAWRSLDGGTTWDQVLNIPTINGGSPARFNFGFVFQGKVYLQASEGGRPHPHSYVFDGTEWTQGPHLFAQLYTGSGHHPELFAGKVVFQTVAGGWGELVAFDGAKTTQVLAPQVRDFVVDNGKIYALTMADTVVASSDLLTWTEVVAAPRTATSITFLAGKLYVGTERAQLYEFDPSRTGRVVRVKGTNGP